MPIRIMGYDYGQYRHQIDQGGERYPSITIVLNFSEKKWHIFSKIREEHDMEKLKEWLKISARAGSIEEFLKITNLRES